MGARIARIACRQPRRVLRAASERKFVGCPPGLQFIQGHPALLYLLFQPDRLCSQRRAGANRFIFHLQPALALGPLLNLPGEAALLILETLLLLLQRGGGSRWRRNVLQPTPANRIVPRFSDLPAALKLGAGGRVLPRQRIANIAPPQPPIAVYPGRGWHCIARLERKKLPGVLLARTDAQPISARVIHIGNAQHARNPLVAWRAALPQTHPERAQPAPGTHQPVRVR